MTAARSPIPDRTSQSPSRLSGTLRDVIIVLGRPALAPAPASPPPIAPPAPRTHRDDTRGFDDRDGIDGLDGLAALVAVATAGTGAAVQLVGSVGDDREGDEVIIRLGRARVGHAALLRDPAGRTPVTGLEREPVPRLDAQDVELGLRYLSEVRVLVLAEPLDGEAQAVALEGARYHGAEIIALVTSGSVPDPDLADAGTVLEAPPEDLEAFVQVVARYAAGMEAGKSAAEAFREATDAVGWERADA